MSAQGIRYKQYYEFGEIQKDLYTKSKTGESFKNLLEIILSEENIMLAYRNIKKNTGSKTKGTDGYTIIHLAEKNKESFIEEMRLRLENYKPQRVRRVLIDKNYGTDKRPLGIPTIADRIIQQMFLQVLEPICEAKFYNHSYGFRPLRSTRHAIARVQTLININKLHYTVDIDIKGFFDNVNHNLLIKQLWNIGVKDKRVLAIISKMLKAPIQKEGIPKKGVPQGGILSPLLSNVVLNDLDQWVAGQWECFNTKHQYSGNDVKIANLKRASNLKEGYIVRYADDFRILARDHNTAWKWFHAVKGYLKDRLKLEISNEKSRVINLRKKSSDFLSYKIKAVPKRKKWVAKTNVTDKRIEQIQSKLRQSVRELKKHPTPENVVYYNSVVLGTQQYFKYATHVVKDFERIEFNLLKTLKTRLKDVAKYGYIKVDKQCTYYRIYGNRRKKTFSIKKAGYLFPIAAVKTQSNLNFSQSLNPYDTPKNFVWDKELVKLMRANIPNATIEYLDNRLSRYSMQQGKCVISKMLLTADVTHCHHKVPKSLGGSDAFDNLVIVHVFVHRLIHATDNNTIQNYRKILNLNTAQLRKLNQLRALCKLESIAI
ncbi:group II intron reverse transcriptase/maturase (plasmid) [Alkalihalophilus pseudofirmus OF4]|uniref:Group II intron reverse transcriptase/maturase n=1 Tax=Alkalihalophilus pseudofirmus (strain ATCC BAA-2126 / JCM 17055 / OF4) TaxID=398511 RepID=D3G1A6_ALKPO|nr:group II intron reverse transcriptase/maturase [Alkalihalophilus pseudofirmus]ADC52132.1 group II intron reverse transcriptase/maturase [Alkalihalophilus pseudofirmus OF4]